MEAAEISLINFCTRFFSREGRGVRSSAGGLEVLHCH